MRGVEIRPILLYGLIRDGGEFSWDGKEFEVYDGEIKGEIVWVVGLEEFWIEERGDL